MAITAPSAKSSSIPIFWIAVFFAAGIAAASLTSLSISWTVAVSTASGAAALVLRRPVIAAALIAISFAAAGAALYTAEVRSIQPDRLKVLYDSGAITSVSPVEIEGVLTARPEPSAEGEFLTIRAERLRYRGEDRQVTGSVRLFLPATGADGEVHRLRYGSRIVAACALEREDEYLNPGVIRRTELLDRMGVDASGSIKSHLLIEHIADESVFMPLAWIFDRRAELIDEFRYELGPTAAGIMSASLLGDKHFLDRETAELFREGGTFHILVISGLHITFIGGILLLVVRSFTRNRSAHFLATIIVLWSYTLAVGADVPVVRAAAMFTIILFAYVIYRQGSMLNSLGLCAVVLLAWRPSDLFNPSFHLTFVSVAAIIGIAYPLIDNLRRIGSWVPTAEAPFPSTVPEWLRRFCETLYWREDAWEIESKRQVWTAALFKRPFRAGRISGIAQRTSRYVFEAVVVSAVVQASMLPLLVIYFHRVSLVSIILNLWVGIFVAFESLAVVTASIFGRVSEIMSGPFFVLAELFNWLMLSLPRLLTGHSWSAVRLPAYTGNGRLVYLLYFAALIAAAYALYRWDPFRSGQASAPRKIIVYTAAASIFFLFSIIIFHPFSAPRPDGRLRIDFLDVGQGDAALVTFPDGRTMLVDGGGRMRFRSPSDEDALPFEPDIRRIGESVVSEFLWERGYSSIDYLLATHADTDHMQGLADVARNFSVGAALLGRMPDKDADLLEFETALLRYNVPVINVVAGDVLMIGGVRVEVFYPSSEDESDSRSSNDNSVVLRISYGERSFLLTGDIESHAERAILASGADLAADVIKVPHHGSRTSSTAEFVNAVNPRIAIVPVGRRSPFGHPHPEVIERWRAAGADVRTTSQKGTITISTDGRDLRIETFLP